jgi:hypothetical protein
MRLVVYGDFNCPFSCLASTRADALRERGLAEVEWRAVEHDPSIPAPSELVAGELAAMLDHEVDQVRALLRPGEAFPIRRPPVHPNSAAAVAAFAGAAAGAADELRARLFAALWFEGRDTGDPALVGKLGGGDSSSPDVVAGWRDSWRALGPPVVPVLVLPDGEVARGLDALHRLADMLAPRPGSPPAG